MPSTGTNACRCLQGIPDELQPGSKLVLGASTRTYSVQPPGKRKAGGSSPPEAKRKSVRFGEGGSALSQLIGYSDGRQEGQA